MDLVKQYFGEEVPAFTMCAPTDNRGMIFTDDKGRTFPFEQAGLNVWRSAFDKWLADRAAKSGVEVRDCTSAISCEETGDSVIVTLNGNKNYTEQASYVVDCEGVTGAFKKKLLEARHNISLPIRPLMKEA